MKTSLAHALKNPENGASQISLSSSYQVPATDGRMVLANPQKFCLNFRPPTIAVVYTLEKSKKSGKSGKPRKYIHEIRVDFDKCIDSSKPQISPLKQNKPSMSEVESLCRKLCDSEPTYLNINVISKTQVLNLITKLYEKQYGCQPQASPKQSPSGAAPGAPSNLFSAKPNDDDQISDDYEDDFDDLDDKRKDKQPAAASKPKAEEVEDDWGLDDDWGDLDDIKDKDKKKPSGDDDKNSSEKKRQDLFFGGAKDDVDDLDNLPELGSNFNNKNEDKFNQVMSSSKEGGGLLASIGLKKDDMDNDESIDNDSEEDPHKKSDLFDTSKDRIGAKAKGGAGKLEQSDEDEFDLGFDSGKKDKETASKASENKAGAGNFANEDAELAGMSDDEGPMTQEQQKAIDEQFQMIYEKDPELRKALEKSDVASFSVVEKYQIIEAYMQGGAAGLQIELEDDEEDEKAVMDMSEEEVAMVEAQFLKLYAADPELQSALGSADSLTLLQKYQILVQYQQAGDTSGVMGMSGEQYMSGDEGEVIEHEGKRFRRVQIEGQDGDHLMDEEANIYDLAFNKIGKAGESDDDDDF